MSQQNENPLVKYMRMALYVIRNKILKEGTSKTTFLTETVNLPINDELIREKVLEWLNTLGISVKFPRSYRPDTIPNLDVSMKGNKWPAWLTAVEFNVDDIIERLSSPQQMEQLLGHLEEEAARGFSSLNLTVDGTTAWVTFGGQITYKIEIASVIRVSQPEQVATGN